jgi:arginine decarboxylase
MAETLREAVATAARRRRLHMPGHFGRTPPGGEGLPWSLDWTEVEGLDNLADPRGVLKALAERAAAAFGAGRAWVSVQGATLPVLAGIVGVAPAGGRLVAERLAHRSVLAAALLADLDVDWLPARWDQDWGIALPTDPAAWAAHGPADVAVVTLPTYEGLAHPAAAVVAGARAAAPRVFVDAAHGSHWGRAPGLPPHVLAARPDFVAHGLHKTEPVLTQTGLLLARDGEADAERIAEWWRRLGTSSPSYPLLLSIERYIDARRRDAGGWDELCELARGVRAEAERQGFAVLQTEWERAGGVADPAKLTLFGHGPELARRLRAAGAEPEAVGLRWLTMVLGPAQDLTLADWRHLLANLGPPPPPPPLPELPPHPGPMRLSPRAADRARWRRVALREAAGLVAARAVTPYPPGIPVIMPGEEISAAAAAWLAHHVGAGLSVEGVEEGGLWVVA